MEPAREIATALGAYAPEILSVQTKNIIGSICASAITCSVFSLFLSTIAS